MAALLVAPPVGAGDGEELEGADRGRGRDVGAAAEVEEVALAVGGDDLVGGEAFDQLQLVGVGGEDLAGFVAETTSRWNGSALAWLARIPASIDARSSGVRGRGRSKS
jgi:hypothetical protein